MTLKQTDEKIDACVYVFRQLATKYADDPDFVIMNQLELIRRLMGVIGAMSERFDVMDTFDEFVENITGLGAKLHEQRSKTTH